MEFVQDCLVLKIEERCSDTNELLTTIFVIYDTKECNYIIRGKIADTQKNKRINLGATFSFICESIKGLEDFLTFSICMENKWTYVLYNYDNLPYDSNDITYEFLKEYESSRYEIAGYNNLSYNKKDLYRNLRMLKNVFNYYN
jgi:hypothetical protein